MTPERRKTIHEAMVRLAEGDRLAFPVLVDELWPVLLAFAERGLRHREDAEDVAQEAFYKIAGRIADFDTSRDGLAWAFGIASYEIRTVRRRRQRRREAEDDASLAALPDHAPSQEEALTQQALLVALESVLGTLTPSDREALQRGERDGLIRTAAERKRKQRALERLRDLWRQIHGDT